MENQSENAAPKSNVVSLFGARKPPQDTAKKEPVRIDIKKASDEQKTPEFLEAMRKNSDNEERLRRERLKANQSVLKSYRIKN